MALLNAATAVRLGSVAASRVYAGPAKVWPPNYLVATVGTATTPDPGPLPTQCVLLAKILAHRDASRVLHTPCRSTNRTGSGAGRSAGTRTVRSR